MVYLALAMICSMLVSVAMRMSETYSRNKMSMLAVNYLLCCILALLFTGRMELFPREAGLGLSMGLGAVNGLLYLGGFVLLQWNIGKNGVVLPATFMKLGVLVPTILAITVFGETPGAAQIIGILAAVAAIVLIQGGGKTETGSLPGLILLLLAGGGGDAMAKIYEEFGPAALKDQFLLYTFVAALLLCAGMCVVRREGVAWADVLWGVLISVPNYLSSRFLLLAVGKVRAVVAYPSYSVGTIVLVTLVGVIAFKEKLSARKIAALAIILASLVLLNLG